MEMVCLGVMLESMMVKEVQYQQQYLGFMIKIDYNDKMQQSHKMKKFTHNRMKACLERNQHQDKENRVYVEDFRNKKLSVELPYKQNQSNDSDQLKSIFNEQISVTLQTSTIKNSSYDKDLISLDIRTLTNIISKHKNQQPSLRQILNHEINQIKTFQVRMLITQLLNRLKKDTCQTSIISEKSQSNYSISDSVIKSIIQKELQVLQKNYDSLQRRYTFVKMVRESSNEDKAKLLNEMRDVLQCQQMQLQQQVI